MNDVLINFLIEAKKNTYADETGRSKVSSSRKESVDFEYQKDNMMYHDTFFGGVNFMGCEVLYLDDKVIWGMNYYGNTLDDSLSEEAMDKVLRPALMQVGESDVIPVRGPKNFDNGEYHYSFKVEGNMENFSGIEEIKKDDKLIYRLVCTGGVIK